MNIQVFWADTTFDMRTWAKYSIGILMLIIWIISNIISNIYRRTMLKAEPAIEMVSDRLVRMIYR